MDSLGGTIPKLLAGLDCPGQQLQGEVIMAAHKEKLALFTQGQSEGVAALWLSEVHSPAPRLTQVGQRFLQTIMSLRGILIVGFGKSGVIVQVRLLHCRPFP
jgi:hypothetical protein